MRTLFRVFQYVNILSIDIVAGAIVSALFFAKIFQVEIKNVGLLALGMTVWIIYTIDHLRDAKKILHPASTLRHRFHQENFQTLSLFLFAVTALDSVAIFFIRRQVFEWGLILTIIVLLYLIFQRSLRFLKELFVASLYTAGVLLLSVTITSLDLQIHQYLLMLQFAIAAWSNLVLFSWFDHAFDEQNNQHSFVTILGKKTAQIFLYSLFVGSFLLSMIQVLIGTSIVPVLILSLMNVALFLIFIFRKSLEKDDRYRLIGDAVFLFPLVWLL